MSELASTPPAPMRTRILRSAVRLFAERGFDATTVQEVVADAGVTKGALYHHFSSKDDLLYEIYGSIIGRQQAELTAIAERGLSAAETVREIVVGVVQSTADNAEEALVFFRESHKLDQEHNANFRADRRAFHEHVRTVIERGQQSGEFSAVVPADTVVQVAMGVVNQLPLWYRPDGSKTPRELGTEIADFVLAGLRP
ncbi:TetR/AcrR family transcriptional regulator [Sciscionella sediminilitoris]|uniref:TetR/AcrR family transcriptional regulator n=1 Tax=Sciscionella sediminilitoris TaxID=1445613 RepID=UPI0004DF1B29|nr:TetR/AcrR family transcriptional regulator [Sciscionella sp. SE31]